MVCAVMLPLLNPLVIATLAGIITVSLSQNVSVTEVEVLRGRDGKDGRDGARGLPGPTGPPGEKGDQGDLGPQGERGIAGPWGPEGIAGLKGAVGEKGDRGDPGLPGPQGVQGGKGERGYAAELGPPGLKGDKGDRGEPRLQGEQGPPTGGAVYVRWGRTSCPSGQGTELVYSGRAGGSHYKHRGGGANHLCMPDNPDHLQYSNETQGYSYIYGVEYKPHSQPLQNVINHNVPCAVCCTTTRNKVFMIPAKTSCPTGWTVEYTGYLMTEGYSHHRSTYECVDKDPESVPGLDGGNAAQALLYHVEPHCSGLSCPPYDAAKELTCVVCTR